MGVDPFRGCVLHDPAVLHHHDPVREQHRLFGVVGDEDGHRPAAGEQVHGLHPDLVPQVLVEGGERLVEEHHPGPGGERPQEGHPLLLAAGQGVGITAGEVRHAEVGEEAARPRLSLSPPPAAGEAVADVLHHREVGKEGVVLEHEPDAARLRGELGTRPRRGDGPPPDRDASRLDPFEARGEAEQRALAAAGRAEEADGLARLRAEAHRLGREDGAVAVGHAVEGQPRHGPFSRPRTPDALIRAGGRRAGGRAGSR